MRGINLYIVILTAGLAGCTQYIEPEPPAVSVSSNLSGGVYHRVARGETLWRISNQYGVSLEELVRANRISDAKQIEVGQRLWIPQEPSRLQPASPPATSALANAGGSAVYRSRPGPEGFVWPVEGKVISVFGMRRGNAVNKGIDIQASTGSEVVAARSGQVNFVHESLPGFGKTIILDHGDGFATVYAYVSQILVRKGEEVTQRQVIARVGSSGRADGPALHFEIRKHQKPQNPFYYLP